MRAPAAHVLVADPPWAFDDALPGPARGAEKHYDVLDLDGIMRFSLPTLEPNAWLFLWRVAAMQQEALDVVRAWGFTLKSELVWLKRTVHDKRWFGMGRYVRMEHEVCLIATRGRVTTADHSIRSTFEAVAGRHSAKPDEFYRIVESLTGRGPYVELFSRRHRPGWYCFGNQAEKPPISEFLDRLQRGG